MPLWLVTLLAMGCDGSRAFTRQTDPGASERPAAQRETSNSGTSSPGQAEDRPLPQLALADLSGQSRSLRSRPDEVTVINFWATWCAPCLKELPELARLHEQWAARGLHVVGIAIDSGRPADTRAFAERHGMNYTILVTDLAWAHQHFGVFGLPVTLIVDRAGRIRRRLIGPQSGTQFAAAVRPYL